MYANYFTQEIPICVTINLLYVLKLIVGTHYWLYCIYWVILYMEYVLLDIYFQIEISLIKLQQSILNFSEVTLHFDTTTGWLSSKEDLYQEVHPLQRNCQPRGCSYSIGRCLQRGMWFLQCHDEYLALLLKRGKQESGLVEVR